MKRLGLWQVILAATILSSALAVLQVQPLVSTEGPDTATTEAQTTEANSTEAQTTEANSTEPNSTEPNSTEPNSTEALTTEANLTEAQTTEAQTTAVTAEPSVCPDLDVDHRGFKAIQQLGDIFLPENTYQSIHYYCPDIQKNEGKLYNWWQILVELGGEPGTLKGLSGNPDDTPPENPCERPLPIHDIDKYLYKYTKTDRRTFYRSERVYPRFTGSSRAFNDVRGALVWKPPEKANNTRGYLIFYLLDDTGFWVHSDNVDCQYKPYVRCREICYCNCHDGKDSKEVYEYSALDNQLLASLIGR